MKGVIGISLPLPTIYQIFQSIYRKANIDKRFIITKYVYPKGKLGKKYQFGRAFQLGRTKGNFLFSSECTSPQMPDKTSLASMMQEHEKTNF